MIETLSPLPMETLSLLPMETLSLSNMETRKSYVHNMEDLSTIPKFQKSRSSLCLPCHCVLVESAADIFQLMRQLPCTNLLKMIWKWYIIHRLDATCWCIKIIDGQASLGAENQSKIAVATKIGMKWTFFIYISRQ